MKGADCWGWGTWERGWNEFEQNGQRLLQEIEEKGLTRLAKIVRSHTYAPDLIRITGYKNLNPDDFMPKTWNEVLINYASLHAGSPGEKITVGKKFEKFYSHKDENHKKAIKLGEKRLRQQCEDVEELLNGNISILDKYTFL